MATSSSCEVNPTIFESPALPLLLELEDAGFQIRLRDHDRIEVDPGSKLTADQRHRLVAHKAVVLMLLRVCDVGVTDRRDLFRRQLDATPPPAVPAFLYRPDVPYVQGRCFSCGDEIVSPSYGRCWRCSLAWRLACRLSIPVDLAAVIDEARRVA